MNDPVKSLTSPALSVLVVDDDDMVRFALVRTLAASGYRAQGVASPLAALELLARERWDMVISDYLMPEMTGMELLEGVRQASPDTLRILLTGHAVNQGTEAGDLVYRSLSKPWDNEVLRGEVRRAFEHQAWERAQARLNSLGTAQGF